MRLARADKPEQKIDFDSQLASSVKFIGFFNVESGQHYFAEVKTKHRSVVRALAPRDKVEPVEIQVGGATVFVVSVDSFQKI